MTQLARINITALRPRQNGHHFADDIFKFIFVNENVWIPIMISLKFVPNGLINNIPALVQIMAWGRPGDKPLSEPMMVRLPTHICVTRPQWVKRTYDSVLLCFHPYREEYYEATWQRGMRLTSIKSWFRYNMLIVISRSGGCWGHHLLSVLSRPPYHPECAGRD